MDGRMDGGISRSMWSDMLSPFERRVMPYTNALITVTPTYMKQSRLSDELMMVASGATAFSVVWMRIRRMAMMMKGNRAPQSLKR